MIPPLSGPSDPEALPLSPKRKGALPAQMDLFPRFRYMGSKFRLLEWLHATFAELSFTSCIDAFSGSAAVSYLLKASGKRVLANDSLHFSKELSSATVANSASQLAPDEIHFLIGSKARTDAEKFIERTFQGIFYSLDDLRFLDHVWVGIRHLAPEKRALALAALLRSCIKRQPRGLFTVAGDPERYKDGRRDLSLSLQEHFQEQVQVYNEAVFSNGLQHQARLGDVFELNPSADLVYFDPPYVPRADDNCYVKRYHFLEGLSCYWQGLDILASSKVKKIAKPFTPFSYRRTALEAFDRLFRLFADCIQVLSYSSNAFPGLGELTSLMQRYKRQVEVLRRPHRYHIGTHEAVKRNQVEEFLIIGLD